MAAIFWVQPKFALTIASQLENLPVSAKQVGKFAPFCDKRVVILTANSASARRREAHSDIARKLPCAENILVSHSNHWIMQNDLALVLGAIRSVVETREGPAPNVDLETERRSGR